MMNKKLKYKSKFRYGGGADAGGKKSPGKGTYKSPVQKYTPGPGDTGGQGGNNNTVTRSVSTDKKTIKNPFKNISGNTIMTAALNAAAFPLGYVLDAFNKPKKHPFSANTKKQTIPKPPPNLGGGEGRSTPLCPDGTLPPCKVEKVVSTKPTSPTDTFLGNFQTYNSGGISYGPPPKRGPNPQVPPVKMKNGKMTKKYKMSCPHRPDGIRGVGASIRGHKFIGVR
tara:strand:+ start:375 stop:1049 length:675 start_codon:yes stop_codon:yes gene_type:complete